MPGAPVFGGKKSHKGEAVFDCCKATTKLGEVTNTGKTFFIAEFDSVYHIRYFDSAIH